MKPLVIAYLITLLLTYSLGFGLWYISGDQFIESSESNQLRADEFKNIAAGIQSGENDLSNEQLVFIFNKLSSVNLNASEADMSLHEFLNSYLWVNINIVVLQALILFFWCLGYQYKRTTNIK